MDITGFVKENYEALLQLEEELCQIPAPSYKEEKRAEFCKEWLLNQGFKDAYIDSALNVVLPINCDSSNNITAVTAHTDTVFPDTDEMPYIDDGEIIRCPGCTDDTASVVVMLFAAKFIIENNLIPKDGLLLVCTSGEEALGNLKGVRKLFEDYSGRIGQFISFDGFISQIADKCAGSSRYKVTVDAKGGHSFEDFGNTSAIHTIAQIITRICDIKIPQDSVGKTTYNVGVIEGGTAVTAIAERASMLCDFRSENAELLSFLKQSFFDILKDFKADDIKITCENIGERPAALNVPKERLEALKSITSDTIFEVTGNRPQFITCSTDCNLPLSLGIPSICIGVCEGGGVHTRDEWLVKESMRLGLEIGIRVILKSAF